MLFQISEVVVGVTKALGLAKTHAVDDRSVIERVGDDGVLCGQESFEKAAIRIKTGRVEDGVLGAEILTQGLFELTVKGLCPADEPYRGESETVAGNGIAGRFTNLGMIGKSEVVVGAHVDHFSPVFEGHFGVLSGRNLPFPLVKTGGVDFGKGFSELLLEFRRIHCLRGLNQLVSDQ